MLVFSWNGSYIFRSKQQSVSEGHNWSEPSPNSVRQVPNAIVIDVNYRLLMGNRAAEQTSSLRYKSTVLLTVGLNGCLSLLLQFQIYHDLFVWKSSVLLVSLSCINGNIAIPSAKAVVRIPVRPYI